MFLDTFFSQKIGKVLTASKAMKKIMDLCPKNNNTVKMFIY